MRPIHLLTVSLAPVLAAFVLAPTSALAHTIEAPFFVQADAEGNFDFDWSFVAGPGEAFVGGFTASGTVNVDLTLIGDCFCIPEQCTLAPGESFDYGNLFGKLTDPSQQGIVQLGVFLCEGGGPTHEVRIQPAPTTGVDDGPAGIGRLRALPNPFRSRTTIEFTLESPAPVELTIFDSTGRRVRHLAAREYAAGTHDLTWNGRSDAGARLPAGIYFVRLGTANHRQVQKLVLLP